MKIGIYSVKDAKQEFLSPTFELYDSVAVRSFSYGLSVPGVMKFAPEDYSLYKIGTFESDTGVIESVDPILIISGKDIVNGN